jgi:Helix-turn-helix domain
MGARRPRSGMAGRLPMRSPGRPPVGRREHRQRFWAAIAGGLSSEEAGVAAGVSAPVGVRWFRESGGMDPLAAAPLSGRYLSFAEREELAVLRACAYGVREIARQLGRSPSTISRELRRNAATRGGRMEYRARPPSGTPTGGPGVRRSRSWPPTTRCAPMCRTGSPG